MAELEAKLEGALEGVADDLAMEVGREHREHLLLMQSQVDKQVGVCSLLLHATGAAVPACG